MILVTGATGNVGAEVVRALAATGQSVQALVRDPQRTALPEGVESVAGDLSAPETLTFEGIRAAFLLPGYPGVAQAAAKAGVGTSCGCRVFPRAPATPPMPSPGTWWPPSRRSPNPVWHGRSCGRALSPPTRRAGHPSSGPGNTFEQWATAHADAFR